MHRPKERGDELRQSRIADGDKLLRMAESAFARKLPDGANQSVSQILSSTTLADLPTPLVFHGFVFGSVGIAEIVVEE
jgi:hypothetical protein